MQVQMPVKVKEHDGIQEITVTKRNSEGDITIWSSNDGDESLYLEIEQIEEDDGVKFSVKKRGDAIESVNDELIEEMGDRYLAMKMDSLVDDFDGIEHEDNSKVPKQEKDPYDPKLIRVEPKNFPIQYVCTLIRSSDLDLAPDFQRGFVWSDITRKSRLIESLLLRIPIPVFYLVQDDEGKFQVVDGVQRLTVINDFVNNKFRLKNLEYLHDCEGCFYNKSAKKLDPLFVKRIDQTQLTFNIIDPQTPEQVRYDIFRRINTGGKTLNNQEIRNCLEKNHVRKLLRDLSSMESFKKATRGSIKPTRMADKEVILRFIAFYMMDHNIMGQISYKGDMDQYLDNTVSILNKHSESEFSQIKEAFNKAMDNAYILFGDRAFRKSSYINRRRKFTVGIKNVRTT
ncbi:DUF262 domain-containing protein [Oribacterium sp. WCC10]|uniref:DUF262 domain-containing protein n=1 Tax=Oribacterium sp. WCC10 TaxID=1855343 RepID=UPI0008E41675|nr:DUF262 domain-containing protein [Oribacterium sp. WCC10]SFG83690.1 Protein of unknown function DUF262 [Oribacterium sp. WCC10]